MNCILLSQELLPQDLLPQELLPQDLRLHDLAVRDLASCAANTLAQQPICHEGEPVSAVYTQQPLVITDTNQVQHIRHILQAQCGDWLKIGVVGGWLGQAQICAMDETTVTLHPLGLDRLPPAKLALTVILALPRPKVLRRLLLDMAAIGVARIVLVNSARTQKSYWQSPLLDRRDEFLLEGLQQGVDTILPEVYLRPRFKPFVEDELATWLSDTHQLAVLHPSGGQTWYAHQEQAGLPAVVAIGAEGGWVDYEIGLFEAVGSTVLSLGERILRTEAAVNVVCGRYLA